MYMDLTRIRPRYSTSIIVAFIITALYDIILQLSIHKIEPISYIIRHIVSESDWFKALEGTHIRNIGTSYFKRHTPLAAALIAGFVGAFTQALILSYTEFPQKIGYYTITRFLLITFLFSAIVGLPMYEFGIFPHLNETYYDTLGRDRAAITDGMSGIVVQSTYIFIVFMLNYLELF